MKKIIATWAAFAFAATLTSCEMKKTEVNENTEAPEINVEIPAENIEAPAENIENLNINSTNTDPKMIEFEEKQAKMWELFVEFEKNNPEFKTLQEEINAIFTSWEEIWEEQMKRVEEIDSQIRALFTPEMKALDEELKEMWNEIFWQTTITEEAPVENNEMLIEDSQVKEIEEPMMISN